MSNKRQEIFQKITTPLGAGSCPIKQVPKRARRMRQRRIRSKQIVCPNGGLKRLFRLHPISDNFRVDARFSKSYSCPNQGICLSSKWATGRKVWQGTVTPSRRRTPGSIPGSPTTSLKKSMKTTAGCPTQGKSGPKHINRLE